MAKEQGLSLNPTKISGACGRLMCCLKYEHEAYEEMISRVPKEGAIVETPDGQGVVISSSLLKELVKVKLDNENETDLKIYDASDVKVIKDVSRDEIEEEVDIDLEELKELED
jgi:cell fate regulator YaaT (PSP1 superfamily)